MTYYNEFDPAAAAWIRELIRAGILPAGHVDERSIRDVQPADLAGFTQCHFFAGIGGWPFALRLARWPESVGVWTGSCPCQPFSAIGYRRGVFDPRHLWPEFFRLIAECRPAIVFGEQVASADAEGWLDGVFSDLESSNYTCGAADLCSAGIGAPQPRQRFYWMAHANGANPHEWAPGGQQSFHDEVLRYPWDSFDAIQCADGETRRVEPGFKPMADGIPGRLDIMRGFGNAIDPWLAAEFIRSARETVTAA